MTTGTPILLLDPQHQDQRSKDYGEIKDLYRPGTPTSPMTRSSHPRPSRWRGRARGRPPRGRRGRGRPEILGPRSDRWLYGSDGPRFRRPRAVRSSRDRAQSVLVSGRVAAERWEKQLAAIRKSGSSIGAVVEVVASGVPAGLGEPIYDKLDADLAKAMMSSTRSRVSRSARASLRRR